MFACPKCGKRTSLWQFNLFRLLSLRPCHECDVAQRVAENTWSPRPRAFPNPPRIIRWRRFPFWSFVFLLPVAGFFVGAFVVTSQ